MIKESNTFKWLNKNKGSVVYWVSTGFVLAIIANIFLYIFVEYLNLTLIIATILSAEIGLLIRFLVNQKLIFNKKDQFIKPLINFHIASSITFIVWVSLTNILSYLDIYYIAASILALIVTTTLNFIFNFFWVWRKETQL